MAYIPAAGLTLGEYGKTGAVYASRREVREQPRVDFSWSQRVRSEGLSRELASHLLSGFRKHGLLVKSDKPIRDRVIRCRRCRPWVPAVVRRNAVPAKLLLEVCNLNNDEDRRLLQTRAFRQRVAEAIVDGILAYYDQSADVPQVVASSP
jgi:N-acetylmuramoyl-L-alanine amidase